MNEPTRAAVYCRPSTAPGNTDDQMTELPRIASARGWPVVAAFTDEPPRIASVRSDRAALDALLQAAGRREFEVVVVTSIDHLGTSLCDILRTVNQLRRLGIDIVACEQDLDTTSPAGPAISAAFAAMASCERALHQQRARTSLNRARRAGVRIGRPSNLNDSVRGAILALWERDVSIRAICSQLRVGTGTVRKVLEAATSSRGPKAPPSRERAFSTPLEPLEPARNRVPA